MDGVLDKGGEISETSLDIEFRHKTVDGNGGGLY